MSRMVTTAAVASLGGCCFALVVVWLAQGTPLTPSTPAPATAADRQAVVVPERCRVITIPESSCEAAWAAKRRAFFATKDRSR